MEADVAEEVAEVAAEVEKVAEQVEQIADKIEAVIESPTVEGSWCLLLNNLSFRG